jgi:hypothetical protein
MSAAFDTAIEETSEALVGPLRGPRQMLATQEYDSHASIHDDATAQKLGFKGGTIEGPTHFSQFAPLCVKLWGAKWFEAGCLSAHYRNPCFEGERVRAYVAKPAPGAHQSSIWMLREDGVEILKGTASIGADHPPTALEQRLTELRPPEQRVILRDVTVGMRSPRLKVKMDATQHMGALYPFSLADKLEVITERSPWYSAAGATTSPWSRAIIPFEMISVLLNHSTWSVQFPIKGPVVGLFADQEIRLIRGPLFVGEEYEIEREIVALSGSKRTESMWVRTSVYPPGSAQSCATMLLNSAYLKDSYANYATDAAALAAS